MNHLNHMLMLFLSYRVVCTSYWKDIREDLGEGKFIREGSSSETWEEMLEVYKI